MGRNEVNNAASVEEVLWIGEIRGDECLTIIKEFKNTHIIPCSYVLEQNCVKNN